MPIRILVNGAFGRMGLMTVKTINEHPEFELVGQTGREYDLKKSIQDSHADVVIDFTNPTCVFNNAKTIIETGARPVIGTSGLKADEIKKLQKMATEAKVGGIIAPNFSLGAVLMMKHAKDIARYMPQVEIIEMHHTNKMDSPSGTSIRSAEILAEIISSQKNAAKTPTKNAEKIATIPGARGADVNGVAIHSVRLPGFLAQQKIIFGNSGETLTISHNSIDRESFMPGVCLACEKAMTLTELVYGLEEIL